MARREPTSEPSHRRGVTQITRVSVESGRGVFMISVAAELAEMHPQTLRMYEARGLIEPKRSPKGTRLYSHEDVERLRRIQEMTSDLGLNLAGVERVLALESQLEQMNERIEQLEVQALHAEVQLAEELEQVRRSFRAELAVPYRGGQIVRAADARSPFTRGGNRADSPQRPTQRRPDGSRPS
ncbi:MAG: heat shock protein transcriptional repressor HspR [Solirubrobacterales bacterium]